jgi:hypothetical protein
MLSELQYVDGDGKAIQWAFGCLVTGIKLRVNLMIAGNLKIARWIFLPEILLCFVPLSFAWLDSIFGGSGVIRLNVDVIYRYFLGVHGGQLVLIWMISTTLLGTLGPVGLVAGFRLVVLGRPLRIHWLRVALVIGPLLYGLLFLISRVAVAGTAAVSFNEASGTLPGFSVSGHSRGGCLLLRSSGALRRDDLPRLSGANEGVRKHYPFCERLTLVGSALHTCSRNDGSMPINHRLHIR